MRTDPGKVAGVAVLFVAVFLAMITTISVTNFTILDTDSATYVIVVMLMLFAFIAFSLKEKLKLNKDRVQVLFGTLIFSGYLLLLSYLRTSLSFTYATFGIGSLLIPVAITSFIVVIFGFDGIKRLWPIPVYAMFASPLLLMPVLMQGSAFANANAHFVYGAMKLLGIPATINGITITSAAGASISIASTCAPIGTFIALIMFLVPVAYLFKGTLVRKALWVASGFGLMMLLNFARMFFIAYSWSYYGITQAVSTFHIFAGQILFYAAIIVMILLAGRYGMRIQKIKKGWSARLRGGLGKGHVVGLQCAVALLLGIMALLFTLPYLSAVYASPSFFYGNITTMQARTLYRMTGQSIGYVYPTAMAIGDNYTSYAFAVTNASGMSLYVLGLAVPTPSTGPIAAGASKVTNQGRYLTMGGVSIGASLAQVRNYTFELNYFALPFSLNGNYYSVNYEFLALLNSTVPSCTQAGYKSAGLFNYVESSIYNTINGNLNYGAYGFMCGAYLVARYG